MLIEPLNHEFEDFLQSIRIESEFIDPVEDIIQKIRDDSTPPISIPYGVRLDRKRAAFFTLDLSNPPVELNYSDPETCWLGSFFIAQDFQGRGLAKPILSGLITAIPAWHPQVRRLSLTVNFRNHLAKKVYGNSGFKDTGQVFWGGPIGPQHIYAVDLAVKPPERIARG